MTVYKYPLPDTHNVFNAPQGAKPVHVGLDQSNMLCVWMLVDPAQPAQEYRFHSYWTGVHFDRGLTYVGSCWWSEHVDACSLMYHVFQNK